MKIDAEDWFALAHWAKENDHFMGRDRAMLYNMGRKKAREEPLTIRQARYAFDLHKKSIEMGFERPQE